MALYTIIIVGVYKVSSKKPIRTFGYVDGFNLYHGMMDESYTIPGDKSSPALRKYLWLDLTKLLESFLMKNYVLERLHYFTAPVLGKPSSARRQSFYWKALESTPRVIRQNGIYIPIRIDPNTKEQIYEEKKSDTLLALQAYDDALVEKPDCMIFCTADTDQVPTIERIQKINPDIEIRIIFPPCRGADELRLLVPSNKFHRIKHRQLESSQFDDVVKTPLFTVTKPAEWA